MVHIKKISVARANENGDESGPPWLITIDDLMTLLGGSVQDVLLSLVAAKGKGQS